MSVTCQTKQSPYVAKLETSVFSDLWKLEAANETPHAFVEVMTASICGTDGRTLRGDKSATPSGITLGHEAGGCVVYSATGRFQPGDKVIILPHVPCDVCIDCQKGFTNLCRNMKHLGIHRDGTLASHGWFPEQCLHRVAADFPEDLMPLVEPLACVDRGIRLLVSQIPRPVSKLSWLVVGGGPIGALHSTALRERFADRLSLFVIEPNRLRRESIRVLGVADEVVDSVASLSQEFDFATICASAAAATRDALESIRLGGKLLAFSGINESDLNSAEFPDAQCWEQVHRRERADRYVNRIRGDFEMIGSSGYQVCDVERSLQLLTQRTRSFAAIQNVVVNGLDSATATFQTGEGAQRKTFDRPAVEVFLSPQGIEDPQFGGDIARALKVLFRIAH